MMRAAISTLSLLLLSSFSLVFAQDAEPPLLIHLTVPDAGIVQSDLYRYTDNQWEPVTSGGYKGGFNLSPDGTQIAYQIAPDFLRELVEEHGVGHLATAARDIAVFDLTTSEQRIIAGQPSDVEIREDNQNFSGGVVRSQPVWSPDGNAIAWTEQDYPEQDGVARVVMAEVATGEIRVLDDALPQMTLSADGLPTYLIWGEPGIAVFTSDPDDPGECIRLYDPDAGTMQIIQDTPLRDENWRPFDDHLLWVNDGDSEVIVVRTDNLFAMFFDPNQDEASGLSYQLEFVSAANPDLSPKILWDLTFQNRDIRGQLFSPDGTMLDSWADDIYLGQVAMSPSGQAVAYLRNNEVYLWQDGSVTTLPLPEGMTGNELFWGHMNVQFGAEYDSVG